MGIVRRWAALPALAALAGCGIVGPIYDPGLSGAPRMACAEVAAGGRARRNASASSGAGSAASGSR